MQLSATMSSTPTINSAPRAASRSGLLLWLAFLLCAAVAVGLFAIPAFIIRPFRYQSPGELRLAMEMRQHAPVLTLIAAMGCFVSAFALWRGGGTWRKVFLALTLLLVASSAVMSRINYFEWMFHPLDGAQFLAQSDSILDPKEMVMSVRLGDESRAYPIIQMAYHHVLNDEVAGVPIAVTY